MQGSSWKLDQKWNYFDLLLMQVWVNAKFNNLWWDHLHDTPMNTYSHFQIVLFDDQQS